MRDEMTIRRLQNLKIGKNLEGVVVATILGDTLEEPQPLCLGITLCTRSIL